jgi:hypothetical protein
MAPFGSTNLRLGNGRPGGETYFHQVALRILKPGPRPAGLAAVTRLTINA